MRKNKIMAAVAVGVMTFSFLIFFYSCQEEKGFQRPEIEADNAVEIAPSDETLHLSSFIDSYSLAVPDGILLADITKIFVCDSLFIVQGNSVDGMLHLFDRNGRFLETILKKGQGPEEAINITTMKLCGNDLYFLVNVNEEIIRYSLKDRKLVERFRLPSEVTPVADFEITEAGTYLLYHDFTNGRAEEYKLYVYDKQADKILYKWLPMHSASTEYLSFSQNDCLYQRNGEFYFYEVFQKGVYKVKEGELEGYIAFKDNKYTFPDDKLYASYDFMSFYKYATDCPYVWSHRLLYEGPHFITSAFLFKDDFYWNLIDKQNWTSSSYTHVYDDVLLDTEMSCEDYMFQTNIQGDVRYFTLSYGLLSEVMEEKKEKGELEAYAQKHPDLIRTYEQMSEDTNDIIVMFHEK